MITGPRVRLRAIEQDDIPVLVKWRNDPDVYLHFFEHEPLSEMMQRRWVERLIDKGDEKMWLVETVAAAELIGTIGLVHTDWRNRKAEWGRFLIYPSDYRRKGYGAEALALLLQYVFDHMNLNRLYCEVFADNGPAIALYRKFEFREEGTFRQHIFRCGHYRDVLCMSLLKSEYEDSTRAMCSRGLVRWAKQATLGA